VIRFRYRNLSISEEAVRRYPADPEVWLDLGEARFHFAPPLGGVPAPALEPFDRAIALDPGFAPAYEHTVRLAIRLNRPDLARKYAVIPEWLTATTFRHALEPGTAWPMPPLGTARQLRGLPWWLARRDTVSLAQFALRAAQETRTQESARGKSCRADTSTLPRPRISHWPEPIPF
jgi:hypothetical protein